MPAASRTRTRRPIVAGLAATGLAAAGVAVMATSGSGTGSSPGRPSASGLVNGHNAAYVLKHVRARLAADDQSSYVEYGFDYTSGKVNRDGSLSDLGARNGWGWDYTAPDGTIYEHNFGDNAAGSPSGVVGHGVTGPVVNGWQKITLTLINNNTHTYSVHDDSHGVVANTPPEGGPAAGLGSTAPEVEQQLQNGELTEKGTTAVNGTQAIALQTHMTPTVYDGSDYNLTLYVNAQSYQPLRLVTTTNDGNPDVSVANYEPATAANIAKAKDFSVPAGYTKVANAGAEERTADRPMSSCSSRQRPRDSTCP